MYMRVSISYLAIAALAVSVLTGCGNSETAKAPAISGSESSAQAVSSNEPVSESVFAMDTYMTITAYDGENIRAVSESIDKIKQLEALWNVNDEGSDIYKINNSSEPVTVDEQTAELMSFSLGMCESTNGALDITLYPVLREWGFTTGEYKVPDEDILAELMKNTGYEKVVLDGNTVTTPAGVMTDLGSVGKGRSGDCVAEIMRGCGVTSALLDLGGNIQVVGRKTDGSKWKIGLKDPYGRGNFGILEAEDTAVITSGGYERYFEQDGEVYWHILDPAAGSPAKNGIISATAVGSEGRLCDALSTSLFVMGEERAKEYWRSRGDFEMILVTDDDRVLITEGLEDSYTSGGLFSETEVIRRDS